MRKWQMTKNRKIKDLYNLLSLICFYSSIVIKEEIKQQNKETKTEKLKIYILLSLICFLLLY